MAIFNVRRTGYATLGEMAITLINDMMAGAGTWNGTGITSSSGGTTTTTTAPGTKLGFKLVYPSAGQPTVTANLDVNTGYIKTTTLVTDINGVGQPVARYIFECTGDIDVKTTTTQSTSFSSTTTTLTDGWRICIDFPLVDAAATSSLSTVGTSVFSDFMAIYVGTSVQLRNDGTIVALPNIVSTGGGNTVTFLEPAGNVGGAYRTTGVAPASQSLADIATAVNNALKPTNTGLPTSADVGFYNRINVSKVTGYAIPLNYEIVMSKRGIWIGVWDSLSEQTGLRFNWVLVQRSVDRVSGAIRGRTKTTETGTAGTYGANVAAFLDDTATSVAPVWCVSCVNNKYYKFNPREQDIGAPSRKLIATDNTEDSTAVLNPFDQQSLTDDSKYVVTFLSNLNTSRFKYPDELDLVGTVSSDVIGAGTEATVTVYGEIDSTITGTAGAVSRTYRALPPNAPFGTGMRLVSLVKFNANMKITVAAASGGTATLTYATQAVAPFAVGTVITVSGMTPAAFNGVFTVLTCSTTTVTYALTGTLTGTIFGTASGLTTSLPMSETP